MAQGHAAEPLSDGAGSSPNQPPKTRTNSPSGVVFGCHSANWVGCSISRVASLQRSRVLSHARSAAGWPATGEETPDSLQHFLLSDSRLTASAKGSGLAGFYFRR